MERSIGDVNDIPGLMFACSKCNNTRFIQECFVKIKEIVVVKKQGNEITLVAEKLSDDDDFMSDIEHENEFICPKCNTIYSIHKEGEQDMVVQMGLEEDE